MESERCPSKPWLHKPKLRKTITLIIAGKNENKKFSPSTKIPPLFADASLTLGFLLIVFEFPDLSGFPDFPPKKIG